jgi:predicted phage terminase large subunit-like protein
MNILNKHDGADVLNAVIRGTQIEDLHDEELFAALASKDYSFYCQYVTHRIWKPYKHLQPVIEALEKVARRELTRLMIFMPPRHGKSMAVSETFPSYFIGLHPSMHIIIASYGDVLAQQFGRRNKQKVEEFGKSIFNISISADQASKVDWELALPRGGGAVTSVGIGGAITGKGADLLIIDDPIKNREEANSITYRNKVWEEWQNTLRTRLEGKFASVIIIATRWHHDDLVGRLLNAEYAAVDDWTIISLPAIAEQNDILGRAVGEPLCAELGYDKAWATKTKADVGSYVWDALFQQHPSVQKGSIFKRYWWRFYNTLPLKFDRIIQSWDMAFKDMTVSSFVVGQVWGLANARIYLLDQLRGHFDFVKTLEAVSALSAKWPISQSQGIYVEDKANGPAVISVLKEKIMGLIAVTPQGSKTSRAYAVTPLVEAANVYLPNVLLQPWVDDYIAELTAFPTGTHDDQVDATTQALSMLAGSLHQSTEAYEVLKNASMNYIGG